MPSPKLVRIRRNKSKIIQDCDIYIGREVYRGGWNLPRSKWANPFTIKQSGSVGKACLLYYYYLRSISMMRIQFYSSLDPLIFEYHSFNYEIYCYSFSLAYFFGLPFPSNILSIMFWKFLDEL